MNKIYLKVLNKIYIIIKSVLRLLLHPKSSFRAVYDDANREKMINELSQYKDRFFNEVSLNDLIGDNFPSIYPISYLSDGSGATDFLLLNSLAKRISDCCYLEIGTWRGESITNVSRFAKECVSISYSREQAKKLYSQRYVNTLNFYCDRINHDKITLIGANSRTFDFSSLDKKFDLIFIDGDHSYEGIVNDTKNALKLLKNNNSIIIWHDYTDGCLERIMLETFKAILDAVPQDLHKYIYHVQNTMCAILYLSDIKSGKYESFPRIPSCCYEVSLRQIPVSDSMSR